jgi:uncharacterized damage-inducible protein DinB
MNPVKIYDYLTKAREKVFDAVRLLPPQEYAREFPFGLKTFGTTITHMMIVEWAYTERMQKRDLPPYHTWPIQDEKPPAFEIIEKIWREQAPRTREIVGRLSARDDWNREFEFISTSRDGKKFAITCAVSDIFTQMVVHEVHHRAQVMVMLREAGRPIADLDYSYFMYGRREV